MPTKLTKELPEMIRRRAALFREMAACATSNQDRHDYRWQAQRLEKQAAKLEKENG